jgi:lysophospholipid acyltransferase (LPLAT)-like uncharacterized protein
VKRWKVKFVGFLIYCIARAVYGTLRLNVVNEEAIEKERAVSGRGVLLASWHGRSFIPIFRFTNRRYWSLVSTSRDGELQNELFTRLGYNTVRGSTSARGAVVSALTMSKELRKGGVLALTPDGPRGPRHFVHGGVIFLAEKSGCKVIPAGISAWPRITFKTWDNYILPAPFAKAVMIFGDPIEVPAKLTEDERTSWCTDLAEAISTLETKAEQLVKPESRHTAFESSARI